jgi:hypothetical protein
MNQHLIQRARDIAADQYIRLTMKNPTNARNAASFAEHVQRYSGFMRSGAYDDSIEVQSALVALRSVLT